MAQLYLAILCFYAGNGVQIDLGFTMFRVILTIEIADSKAETPVIVLMVGQHAAQGENSCIIVEGVTNASPVTPVT